MLIRCGRPYYSTMTYFLITTLRWDLAQLMICQVFNERNLIVFYEHVYYEKVQGFF